MKPPSSPEGPPGNAAFFAQVSGRVQGVGFRYTCLDEARRLGLHGWVRNTPGGEVEVWAEGSGEKLAAFLAWLHRGPPQARVDAVHHRPMPAGGKYRDFSIKY